MIAQPFREIISLNRFAEIKALLFIAKVFPQIIFPLGSFQPFGNERMPRVSFGSVSPDEQPVKAFRRLAGIENLTSFHFGAGPLPLKGCRQK